MITKNKLNLYIELFAFINDKLNLGNILSQTFNSSTGIILDLDYYSTIPNIQQITLTKFQYNDKIYYRENSILYQEQNNIKYFMKKNKYYKIIDNIVIDDIDKTFNSITILFFFNSQICYLLDIIASAINQLLDNYILTTKNNLICFNYIQKDFKYCVKQIDISYFYSIVDNYIYVKDIWEYYINSNDNVILNNNFNILINNFNRLINILTDIKQQKYK